MSKMEVSDSCKIHLDGVSLECLAEIGSKEIYGYLDPGRGVRLNLVQKV